MTDLCSSCEIALGENATECATPMCFEKMCAWCSKRFGPLCLYCANTPESFPYFSPEAYPDPRDRRGHIKVARIAVIQLESTRTICQRCKLHEAPFLCKTPWCASRLCQACFEKTQRCTSHPESYPPFDPTSFFGPALPDAYLGRASTTKTSSNNDAEPKASTTTTNRKSQRCTIHPEYQDMPSLFRPPLRGASPNQTSTTMTSSNNNNAEPRTSTTVTNWRTAEEEAAFARALKESLEEARNLEMQDNIALAHAIRESLHLSGTEESIDFIDSLDCIPNSPDAEADSP